MDYRPSTNQSMYNYYLHALTYLTIKRKKLLDKLPLKKTKCNTFAILCEPRSGSTLLHTYLNSHPKIMSYGEVLREKIKAGVPDDVMTNCLTNFVFDFRSSTVHTVGLKLFYEYQKSPQYQKHFASILQRKSIRIIHLVRKDTLKLFASLKMAQKTNIWSSNKSTQPLNEKINVDAEAYSKYAQDYIRHQHEFDELFKHHPVLKISYEDLVDNPVQTLEKVQLFLGVKPRKLFTLLKKQNSDSLESIILNYDEVKNYLFES